MQIYGQWMSYAFSLFKLINDWKELFVLIDEIPLNKKHIFHNHYIKQYYDLKN